MPFGSGFILKFPIFNYLNKLYFYYKIHTSYRIKKKKIWLNYTTQKNKQAFFPLQKCFAFNIITVFTLLTHFFLPNNLIP